MTIKRNQSGEKTVILMKENADETDEPAEPDLRIVNINFMGVLYTTKLALHYFTKGPSRDKCLILKSSLAGYLDITGAPLYNSSKFAVRGLMCNLRRSGYCRVNVIAPWFVNPRSSERREWIAENV
jgi:NADP-dependent 3-hydroxy acid dehydrogenase YdfG